MTDSRPSFEEALKRFRKFAESNAKSTNFVWLTQDRICILLWQTLIFRPDEIQGDERMEECYELACKGDSSVKFLGICSLGEYYLTYLESMPSSLHYPYQFYMSLLCDSRCRAYVVKGRFFWRLINLISSCSKHNRLMKEVLIKSQ